MKTTIIIPQTATRTADATIEYLFSKGVKRTLERKIKGDISVHIAGDFLVCDIHSYEMCYRFTQSSIHNLILEGLPSDVMANTILSDYKSFVIKKFFKY